jgi:hypothetical protein
MPRRKNASAIVAPDSAPQVVDVRRELMKRIYVAKDSASTPPTWLHHPECPPKAPECKAYACRAFEGLEVEKGIDAGWWNDVPGDH